MQSPAHPVKKTDLAPQKAGAEPSVEAYDWQSLAKRPGIIKRTSFGFEALRQLMEQNWQDDCVNQNARFLWIAFCMALGAAFYYELPDEPNFWWLLATATGLCVWVYLRARKGLVVFPLMLFVSAVIGVGAASEHGSFSTSPVLAHSLSSAVTGRLLRVEQRGTADKPQERWTFAVESIEKLTPEATPKRLLLVRRGSGEPFEVGARLKLWAHLTPLQQPAYPGGFDYGRYLWSRAIGGQGYLSRSIKPLPDQKSAGWSGLKLAMLDRIERTRTSVAHYILHRIDGTAGGLAVALAVGKRDFLAPSVEAALRRSGLAHILAISGLHMALVAMSVFWGARGVLVLLPQLALRYSVKQWSAGLALLFATAYLVFSGASVATIRAYCMTSIFLLAILAGRPAVTMHNLAIVLVLLILFQPYGVVEAGMQMSFAATAALIASYDRLSRFRLRHYDHVEPTSHGFLFRSVFGTGKWIMGIGLTSIIASLAVLPLSIAHFQQMAPFGLAANLLAMPVISLVVMPMGLVSVFLTPFGLQAIPLEAVRWGLDWVIAMATMVSKWGSVEYLVVKSGGPFLVIALLALAIYTIHRRLIASLAIIPLLIAVAVWWYAPQPDLWISQGGTRIASRDANGAWQRTGGRSMTVDYRSVLKADGDGRALGLTSASANGSGALLERACDKDACYISTLYSTSNGLTPLSLAIVKKPSAFAEECRVRDIIVSPLPIPETCVAPRVKVGEEGLKQSGAQYIYFSGIGRTGLADWLSGYYALLKGERSSLSRKGGTKALTESSAPWTVKEISALPIGNRPWMPSR